MVSCLQDSAETVFLIVGTCQNVIILPSNLGIVPGVPANGDSQIIVPLWVRRNPTLLQVTAKSEPGLIALVDPLESAPAALTMDGATGRAG